MNVTPQRTDGPWVTRDWTVTGAGAAADMVATQAVKDFDASICVSIVAQARGLQDKLVATTYARNQVEADANANFITKAVNAHETLVAALKKIGKHTETAAAGDAYDKAMALVDIEYEVRNALIAAGEPM